MDIWKLGTNWGEGAPDFISLLYDKGIVLSHIDRLIPKKGDLVLITTGHDVRALAEVQSEGESVTNNLYFEDVFLEHEIDYNDKVFIAPAIIHSLEEQDVFKYKLQQGIVKVHQDDIKNQALKLLPFYQKKHAFYKKYKQYLSDSNEIIDYTISFYVKSAINSVRVLQRENIINVEKLYDYDPQQIKLLDDKLPFLYKNYEVSVSGKNRWMAYVSTLLDNKKKELVNHYDSLDHNKEEKSRNEDLVREKKYFLVYHEFLTNQFLDEYINQGKWEETDIGLTDMFVFEKINIGDFLFLQNISSFKKKIVSIQAIGIVNDVSIDDKSLGVNWTKVVRTTFNDIYLGNGNIILISLRFNSSRLASIYYIVTRCHKIVTMFTRVIM